jgi:hypothetical protein
MSPDGSTLQSRVTATHYLDGAHGWGIGENIAWGTGGLGTPRSIVRAWMHSPGHRANILNATFRDIGIGIAAGAPIPHGAAATGGTYTTDFGYRANLRRRMADVQPLEALHYDQAKAGPLQQLVAPALRRDRPRAARGARGALALQRGRDRPARGRRPVRRRRARLLQQWQDEDAVIPDEPAFWALVQDYTGPDGRTLTRRGIFARVRVTEYGPGKIRPHERTHPGPREDRLKLTRATKANLSPIFSLYDDPEQAAWKALEPHTNAAPFGEATDDDGTVNRLWRIDDPHAIDAVQGALAPTELLIADGHHRYETARVYADEIGGEGPHRYVLMCLVALEDPGLTVFPTHRLIRDTTRQSQEALAGALRESFDIVEIEQKELPPARRRRATRDGLYRLVLQARVPPHAEGPGDRRPRSRRRARALPPARHGDPRGPDPQRPARD